MVFEGEDVAELTKEMAAVCEMQDFEYLSGDVNWRVFGCNWYRSCGNHKYEIIELRRFPKSMDAKKKYGADCYVVDLTPGGQNAEKINGMLREMDLSWSTVRDELEVLWAVVGQPYCGSAFMISGDNPDDLLEVAKIGIIGYNRFHELMDGKQKISVL